MEKPMNSDADRAARAPADSQPAPEYVGNGMFKGETIEKAAEHWANWCDVRCMTGLSEFLRVVAASAPADSAPAWAIQAVIEYRYTGGTHWCQLGPAERVKPNFDGVYRLQGGVFPVDAPADSVLEDAARYRFLSAHCRSTSEHWGGRWSIIVDGPAPKSHDSEDDFDEAVDAARNQGANHD